ncbi:retrovirus-related Pol polyprotein [Elysia marginata]|uniref:Retrovirus-related Pol polyprotein n=1 Tax=Elysia marginata TaxID=1093978 RepID=A0AAV4HMG3_9GAST|nr:retrovirus-related Pol polyprotein [Elysia marginata]
MAVESVAMKLPTFWVTSPLAWFAQAEAQFALRNITPDETKYFHILAALDTNKATRAVSLLTAPPPSNKYGAQVLAVPASRFDRRSGPNDHPLQAANGTTIATYGSRNVSLCFNGRMYTARLIVADIRQPLLGADFFQQHNLLVDLRGQRLIEADTFLSCPCTVGVTSVTDIAPIETESSKFRKTLQEFPAILQPTFSLASVSVEHHVLTTGPPFHAWPDD